MEALQKVVAVAVLLLLTDCAPVAQLNELPSEVTPNFSSQALIDHARELYRSSDDLVLGNSAGQIAVVEFFDYNCGYCKRNAVELTKLIQSESDVRVVIKELPILGKGSMFAAKAALASARQGKYEEFHTALNKMRAAATEHTVLAVARNLRLDVDKLRTDMESEDIADVIRRNEALAKALSINGTPTFVFENVIEPRYTTFKMLTQRVANIRENGGCNLCNSVINQ